MRIAIVNDLRLAIESLRRSIAAIPGATVAWIAEDGAEAVTRCAADVPDIILMDMIMPVMDGVEATRRIMRSTPCPILVVTATVEGNAGKVFEALGAGALDAVATPGLSLDGGVVNADPLIRKVKTITILSRMAPVSTSPRAPLTDDPTRSCAPERPTHQSPAMVAIGCSTGGPRALATILADLPPSPEWAVVVIQHIDEQFAPGLAGWLAQATGRRVVPAAADSEPIPGVVTLASTNQHMVLTPAGRLLYTPEPREKVFCPSVDVFFSSLITARVKPAVAVLLTGMGNDGATGLAALRKSGWHTIVQDEATSVVWGMPGTAVRLGAASEVLPVEAIGRAIGARMMVQSAARGGFSA